MTIVVTFVNRFVRHAEIVGFHSLLPNKCCELNVCHLVSAILLYYIENSDKSLSQYEPSVILAFIMTHKLLSKSVFKVNYVAKVVV